MKALISNRELNGKEYVFVHNGTLYDFMKLNIGRFKPIGDTNSEYIFCHLLHCIEAGNITEWNNHDFKWLAEKLRQLNKNCTLNCILSDGNHLFAYKSIKRENNLYFNPIKIYQSEILDYFRKGKVEFYPKKIGMAISSRKLTRTHWYELKKGELIVLKDGRLLYSNFFTS